MKTSLLLLLLLSASTHTFLFDLDLNLHSSLTKGGPLNQQSGLYLKDSFRRLVLTPAFDNIVKELKSNKKSDIIVESLLAILMSITVIGLLFTYLKIKKSKKKILKDLKMPA